MIETGRLKNVAILIQTLIILNEEMEDILEVVKSLGIIEGIIGTIKNKAKMTNGRFFSIL